METKRFGSGISFGIEVGGISTALNIPAAFGTRNNMMGFSGHYSIPPFSIVQEAWGTILLDMTTNFATSR
jgi:hypothetical protein